MNIRNKHRDPVKILVQCGLFTAAVTVGTLISFPVAGGHGFINLGDSIIHAAAFLIGGWRCCAVAAIGSAVSDLILGYTIFVPGTLAIKALMAFVCSLIVRKVRSHPGFAIAGCTVSGLIMPLGYFLYELLLSHFGAWDRSIAFIDVPWNLVQYAVCAVVGSVMILFLRKYKEDRF